MHPHHKVVRGERRLLTKRIGVVRGERRLLTKRIGVARDSGGATFSTISLLPVQYAAPWLKNTLMSDPISPDHSSSCSLLAGRPDSSLAAQSVVAALPLPPPSPAPALTMYYIQY
jgi:hypothetical protein